MVRLGDDFSLSGRRSLCSTFRDELGKHLLVESIHLNRLVRLYPPTCRDPGVADGAEQRKQSCVVATRSGEAEFYALAKSASRALGAVAMAADMAKVVKPRVRVDATASKAIASRSGVGRVRHLHTQVWWVQEAVARRELTIV